MNNTVNVNPSMSQKVDRHIGRIKTLKLALQDEPEGERKQSLVAEMERRQAELQQLKAKLDEVV